MHKPHHLIGLMLGASLLALTGCSATPETPHDDEPLGVLRGQTLSDIRFYIPEWDEGMIVDLSSTIGLEASYAGFEMHSSRWTIAAICDDLTTFSDAETLTIGVVPTQSVDEAVAAEINEDEYAQSLTCE